MTKLPNLSLGCASKYEKSSLRYTSELEKLRLGSILELIHLLTDGGQLFLFFSNEGL